MVDRYGHHADYAYELYGNKALVRHVGWVFTGGTAQYEATFEYEDRTDKLSDCSGGFEELLEVRLSRVNVLSHGTRIRSYEMAWEDTAMSGGLSRLAGVLLQAILGAGKVFEPILAVDQKISATRWRDAGYFGQVLFEPLELCLAFCDFGCRAEHSFSRPSFSCLFSK
jgi:hypothetical protein